MLNILFSTTRQWNVGDEFILFGTINLMKSVFPEGFNAIIYNRHPDLRTDIQPVCNLRNVKLFMTDELTFAADANFRVGFRDNSFKLTTDGRFIDLVVFAGTPEWSNSRCFDLYEIIEKYDLPVIALGIGNRIQDECELVMRNLSRFKLFTVRSPEFVEILSEHISPAPRFLPCPSLCSSAPEKIRTVETVKHIGLIYSCDVNRSEINNCVSTETYNYLLALFRRLKREYPEHRFSLVCHYIDELPFAHSDFPDTEVFYSYDAKDYYDIYHRFDLVIGARVHGIGCAASMGIPGICIMHDFRGNTVNGFLAETLSISQPVESALETVNQAILTIADKSKQLTELIRKTADLYVSLICDTIDLPEKSFEGYSPPILPPISNVFEGRPHLLEAMHKLLGIPDPKIVEYDRVVAERDQALAERNQAVAERNQVVAERNQAVAERNQAVAERDQAVAERDQAVVKWDQAVAERDQAVAERNQAVAERDQAVAERDQAVAEWDQAVAEWDILVNSTTWKMTAPLRALLDFLKRLLKGTRVR